MSAQTPSPDEARELVKRLDAMLTGRPRFHDDQALMWAVMAIRSLAREVEAANTMLMEMHGAEAAHECETGKAVAPMVAALAREVEALRRVADAARRSGYHQCPPGKPGYGCSICESLAALSALNTEEPTVQEEKP